MTEQSTPLQQDFSWHCYGCGKCNAQGLQAETIHTEEGYLCEWHTDEMHAAHPGKFHHGLITTICFCHGAWAATAERYAAEGKVIKDPLEYFYVNQRIQYDVRSPIPLNFTVRILASVSLRDGDVAQVDFKVRVGDTLCAEAQTELVRVAASEMAF